MSKIMNEYLDYIQEGVLGKIATKGTKVIAKAKKQNMSLTTPDEFIKMAKGMNKKQLKKFQSIVNAKRLAF